MLKYSNYVQHSQEPSIKMTSSTFVGGAKLSVCESPGTLWNIIMVMRRKNLHSSEVMIILTHISLEYPFWYRDLGKTV